jgi:prevent-host-death family protein
MLTMTSLEAQNKFGMLIDASQRQPVAVTRRGRPVAVVLSYDDAQEFLQSRERDKALVRDYIRAEQQGLPTEELPLPKTISFELAKFISDNHPRSGREAGDAMRRHLATMSNKAAEEGLTEADINRMLNEDD